MTTTPDGISFSDLQEHLKDAPKDAEIVKVEDKFDGKNSDEVFDIVQKHLTALSEELNHPIGHKLALSLILDNMVDWHTRVGKNMLEDDQEAAGIAWCRDAGKFQACHNIVTTISICDGDFTCITE
jgi:hypothetical protein